MKHAHLLSAPAQALPAELCEILAASAQVRIERIVSQGHCSAPGFWYDQAEREWVALLQGAARVEFADPPRLVTLAPGDYLQIDAHERHRVDWTSTEPAAIWLAVFY